MAGLLYLLVVVEVAVGHRTLYMTSAISGLILVHCVWVNLNVWFVIREVEVFLRFHSPLLYIFLQFQFRMLVTFE